MEEENIFDLAIIGSGPGGYHTALRAASYGAKVALIEKNDRLGGTCLNVGCIPTKALYSSAKLIADIREKAEVFGIHLRDGFDLDFTQATKRKNEVVQQLTDGITQLCKVKKVEVLHGFGKLVGGHINIGFDISITSQDHQIKYIKTKRVILATGSAPISIPAFNIDHSKILNSDDILHPTFDRLPKSLIIIGGGVIGCEFANIFAEFGCEITILEYLPTILATEEPLIVKQAKKRLKHLGIKIHECQNIISAEATDYGVKVISIDSQLPRRNLETAEKSIFEAEKCLVSIGRKKVSEGLGLEDLGVNTKFGTIQINQRTTETNIPGIYAIGDCTGIIMLAHFASYQGDTACAHALNSIGGFYIHFETAEEPVVPSTIFIHPNIGSVGLTRKQAKAKYEKILVGRFSYKSSGKALCMGETEGMMIVIADQVRNVILGATCYGEGAPELIAEITLAMVNNLTVHDITKTIHSHPTISEIVLESVEDLHGLAIHKAGKRR
jgi:dihydrolipoamide dehydrogenase